MDNPCFFILHMQKHLLGHNFCISDSKRSSNFVPQLIGMKQDDFWTRHAILSKWVVQSEWSTITWETREHWGEKSKIRKLNLTSHVVYWLKWSQVLHKTIQSSNYLKLVYIWDREKIFWNYIKCLQLCVNHFSHCPSYLQVSVASTNYLMLWTGSKDNSLCCTDSSSSTRVAYPTRVGHGYVLTRTGHVSKMYFRVLLFLISDT